MTTTQAPAITGTVSHGTLRPQDLAPAFLSALETLAPEHPHLADLRVEVDYVVREAYSDAVTYYMRADDAISDLTWAIESALPEGWYFGTHPGDAADYGVWQDEDEDA
jgi:hypothetical protein